MKIHSRTEYSLLNIATGLGGYVVNTIMGFFCRMIFVKCLSADYLGVNGLFTNIISMLSLTELGIGSAIVYSLYRPLADDNQEKIASLMKVYSKAYKMIGLIVAVIGIALLPFLDIIVKDAPNIKEDLKILYIINLFNTSSSYFFSYKSSLLIASQRNYIVSGINYIITIIQSIVQIIFLLVFKNYLGYLLIQTIGIFIFNIIISKITDKNFPIIKKKNIAILDKKEKQQLFSNIRDLSIYKFSGVLVNSTDNILITFFNGLNITGITSNYTLLVNTLTSILNQIFNSLTSSIGNHNASEPIEKKYEMFNFLNMINFWIYGWVSIGIFFCLTDVVIVCFGNDYALQNSIPLIMALNFYISGVSNIIGTYKHTLGFFKQGRFLQFITGFINILLSILFGKLFGVFGILLATAISRATTHLWYTPYIVYKYGFGVKISEYWKKYLKYTVITLISGFICYNIFQYIVIESSFLTQTILKIVLCSFISNFVYIITLMKTAEFDKLIQYIKLFIQNTRIETGKFI